MEHDDKQVESPARIPDTGTAFAARRTVVKGLASAVPVVMTIGCGQAMAQASNLRCIGQDGGNPPECIDGVDGYVRREDTDGLCSGPDNGDFFGISTPGKGVRDPNGFSTQSIDGSSATGFGSSSLNAKGSSSVGGKGARGGVSVTSQLSLDGTSNTFSGISTPGKGARDFGYLSGTSSTGLNRLVYVDSMGNEVSSGGSPVTLSCYNSFLPR